MIIIIMSTKNIMRHVGDVTAVRNPMHGSVSGRTWGGGTHPIMKTSERF